MRGLIILHICLIFWIWALSELFGLNFSELPTINQCWSHAERLGSDLCLNSNEVPEGVMLKLGFVLVCLWWLYSRRLLAKSYSSKGFFPEKSWPWYQFSFGKWKGLQEEGTSVHKVSLFFYKQMSWNGSLCPVHPKCPSHVDKLISSFLRISFLGQLVPLSCGINKGFSLWLKVVEGGHFYWSQQWGTPKKPLSLQPLYPSAGACSAVRRKTAGER